MRSLRLLLASAAVVFGLVLPAVAETVKLTFVQTNDIDRMEERDGRGGFARVAAVVKAERTRAPLSSFTRATPSPRPFFPASTTAPTLSTSSTTWGST
jgi:hypothetical protein